MTFIKRIENKTLIIFIFYYSSAGNKESDRQNNSVLWRHVLYYEEKDRSSVVTRFSGEVAKTEKKSINGFIEL